MCFFNRGPGASSIEGLFGNCVSRKTKKFPKRIHQSCPIIHALVENFQFLFQNNSLQIPLMLKLFIRNSSSFFGMHDFEFSFFRRHESNFVVWKSFYLTLLDETIKKFSDSITVIADGFS